MVVVEKKKKRGVPRKRRGGEMASGSDVDAWIATLRKCEVIDEIR